MSNPRQGYKFSPRLDGRVGEKRRQLSTPFFLHLLNTWFPRGTWRNRCLHSWAGRNQGTPSFKREPHQLPLVESSSPACHPTKQTEQGPRLRSRPVGTNGRFSELNSELSPASQSTKVCLPLASHSLTDHAHWSLICPFQTRSQGGNRLPTEIEGFSAQKSTGVWAY